MCWVESLNEQINTFDGREFGAPNHVECLMLLYAPSHKSHGLTFYAVQTTKQHT